MDSLEQGPKKGETWDIGSFAGLVFIGMARDFYDNKVYVFQDGSMMFVISKDEFFGEGLVKKLASDAKCHSG